MPQIVEARNFSGDASIVFTTANAITDLISAPIDSSTWRTVTGSLKFVDQSVISGGTFKLQGSMDKVAWNDITGATVSLILGFNNTGFLIPPTAISVNWVRAIYASATGSQQRITAAADVAGSLAGKYLLIAGVQSSTYPLSPGADDMNGNGYAVWFRVSGTGSSPGVISSGGFNYKPVVCDIATNDTAATIASDLKTLFTNAAYPTARLSTDGGVTVSTRNSPFVPTTNNPICYGNGKFVMVQNGRAWQSTNGTDWETNSASTPNVAINQVIWAGGSINLYVAVGGTNATNNVWTSPDGITWTARSSSQQATALACIAFNGTTLIALGNNTTTGSSSTNGTTWSTITVISGNWGAICWNGNVFAATQNAATTTAMTSPNGASGNWTSRTLASGTAAWTGIAAQPSGIIVAVRGGSNNTQVSQDNGVTWATSALPSTAANTVTPDSIVWDSDHSQFIVMGSSSVRMFSTDGVAWSAYLGPNQSASYSRVASGGGNIVDVFTGPQSAVDFASTMSVGAALILLAALAQGQIPAAPGTSGFTCEVLFPKAKFNALVRGL